MLSNSHRKTEWAWNMLVREAQGRVDTHSDDSQPRCSVVREGLQEEVISNQVWHTAVGGGSCRRGEEVRKRTVRDLLEHTLHRERQALKEVTDVIEQVISLWEESTITLTRKYNHSS